MPTVPFCWLLTRFKGKRFVIDWHNLGFSLLEVHKVSPTHVKIAEFFEFFFGHFADAHITVTQALQTKLKAFAIESSVVPDRPSDIFSPVAPDRRRDRRADLAKRHSLFETDPWIVTSTSWTPDEDMRILLDAAERLEEAGARLTIVITGKGPDRPSFEAELKTRSFRQIEFFLHFFESYEDYAEFLGLCDAGVSLHRSSSGLDLPMKGLDMLGAGLPLLSVKYGCINELVQEGENGMLFDNAQQLAELLLRMFISKDPQLERLQEGAVESARKKWATVWEESAKPILVPNK
jgi:beta-1,4-mannosyltransferase